MAIRQAVSDVEIDACFPVLHQLRPHLSRETFVERIRQQERDGYRLAYVDVDGQPVAVANFRFLETLWAGRLLYVDDLVTNEMAARVTTTRSFSTPKSKINHRGHKGRRGL